MEIMSAPASHLHHRLKKGGREAREEEFFPWKTKCFETLASLPRDATKTEGTLKPLTLTDA